MPAGPGLAHYLLRRNLISMKRFEIPRSSNIELKFIQSFLAGSMKFRTGTTGSLATMDFYNILLHNIRACISLLSTNIAECVSIR